MQVVTSEDNETLSSPAAITTHDIEPITTHDIESETDAGYAETVQLSSGHIFHITEVEAAEVSRGVKDLPAETRNRLAENARAYLPARDELMRRHGFIQAWGSLPRPETRLACPALVEGACALYEHRPLICRKFGMPLHHPEQPGRIFACELNFRTGEAFEDPGLVQIQTGLAEDWNRLQTDYDRDDGTRDELPISVAHAILKDYEDHLPE